MKLNYRKSKSKNGSTNPKSRGSRSLRFVVWLVGVEWSVSAVWSTRRHVATNYKFKKGLDWRWSCWRDIGFGGSGNTSDSPEPRQKVASSEAEGWWAGSSSHSSTQLLGACRLKRWTSSWKSMNSVCWLGRKESSSCLASTSHRLQWNFLEKSKRLKLMRELEKSS